jgi:predicted HicB family RNase H-like nuclease
MLKRVDRTKPLYRLNVYVNREVALKVRAAASLQGKTIERYIEDALRKEVQKANG